MPDALNAETSSTPGQMAREEGAAHSLLLSTLRRFPRPDRARIGAYVRFAEVQRRYPEYHAFLSAHRCWLAAVDRALSAAASEFDVPVRAFTERQPELPLGLAPPEDSIAKIPQSRPGARVSVRVRGLPAGRSRPLTRARNLRGRPRRRRARPGVEPRRPALATARLRSRGRPARGAPCRPRGCLRALRGLGTVDRPAALAPRDALICDSRRPRAAKASPAAFEPPTLRPSELSRAVKRANWSPAAGSPCLEGGRGTAKAPLVDDGGEGRRPEDPQPFSSSFTRWRPSVASPSERTARPRGVASVSRIFSGATPISRSSRTSTAESAGVSGAGRTR